MQYDDFYAFDTISINILRLVNLYSQSSLKVTLYFMYFLFFALKSRVYVEERCLEDE